MTVLRAFPWPRHQGNWLVGVVLLVVVLVLLLSYDRVSEGRGGICLDGEQRSTYTTPCLVGTAIGGEEPPVPLLAAFIPSELQGPARFVRAVYREAVRQGIPPAGAVLLTAHFAHSTGYGRGAYNYMLAGIKARGGSALCYGEAPDPGYSYICKCSWERAASGALVAGNRTPFWDGSKWAVCPPGKAPYPFRPYRSLRDGVAAVIRTLKRSRYRMSWAYLLAGSTQYFRQIGYDGWYTGWRKDPEGTYRDWLQTHADVKKLLGSADPGPPAVGGLAFAVLGLAGLWYARKKGWV